MSIRSVVPDLSGINGMGKKRGVAGTYVWNKEKKEFERISKEASVPPMVSMPHGSDPYYDIGFGEYVKSARHKRELMKKHGTVEFQGFVEKRNIEHARYLKEREKEVQLDGIETVKRREAEARGEEYKGD